MKLARLEDRFKIELGEVAVVISPLSGRQKLEMTSLLKQSPEGKLMVDRAAQELYLIKHTLKEISGVKDYDGNDYVLSFESGKNVLTDECADEVLGLLVNTYFTYASTQAISGVFGDVVNPFNGQKLDGIRVNRIIKEGDEKK